MAKLSPQTGAGADTSEKSLRSASQAAQDSSKLLQLLATQLIKLFIDSKFPLQLKLLLIPLLFMVPVYSIMIVIFLGDLTFCIIRNDHINSSIYLLFLGISAPTTIALLLTFGIAGQRYESTKTLEEQLQSVTDARRPRRHRTRSAD